MGIRYEKDTILNWINEMGKFLRLVVSKWEGLSDVTEDIAVEQGYIDFFMKDRAYFLGLELKELEIYVSSLEPEQIRPLAQLLMYDGLLLDHKGLLEKAKYLFELHMRQSGNFSFEDYGFLAQIEAKLA